MYTLLHIPGYVHPDQDHPNHLDALEPCGHAVGGAQEGVDGQVVNLARDVQYSTVQYIIVEYSTVQYSRLNTRITISEN